MQMCLTWSYRALTRLRRTFNLRLVLCAFGVHDWWYYTSKTNSECRTCRHCRTHEGWEC